MRVCPNCKRHVDEPNNFCDRCGCQLTLQNESSGNTLKKVILILLSLFVPPCAPIIYSTTRGEYTIRERKMFVYLGLVGTFTLPIVLSFFAGNVDCHPYTL